jgi:hypothetical protein
MLEVPITADRVFGFGCTVVLIGIMVQSTTDRHVRAQLLLAPTGRVRNALA